MEIKFIDLRAQYLSIKKEVDQAIQDVLDKTAFALGPFVQSFEENFAKAHEAKYCVGVNSGTSALHVSLWALGITFGDEVIIPANTFIATAEAVSLCGATPVFADCEPEYYNMDHSKIENLITSKTKAIIAVHLYGQPAKIDEIKAIADNHNLYLIEDCAQAHLAEYKDRKVGTFGTCGCFSFYPGKNLGAYGEAGAVITNNYELYNRIMALRDHGSLEKYHHQYIGHNYRMEGIQGAVLDVKLKHLRRWTEQRRHISDLYRERLINSDGIVLPAEMNNTKHVYHLFVIQANERDKVISALKERGISTGIHYPIPCHLQQAYDFLDYEEDSLPIAENIAEKIISLPMYPELSETAVDYVCTQLANIV